MSNSIHNKWYVNNSKLSLETIALPADFVSSLGSIFLGLQASIFVQEQPYTK